MSDIATQIRDYYESAVDPVTLDEVTAREGTIPDRVLMNGSRRSVPGWVYALAAAAAVFALVGSVALLFPPSDSETPVADTVTTLSESSPTTVTESTPTTLGVPLASGWARIPHDEAVFGGVEMTSVTVGGPGFVAVGHAWWDGGVWTSVDGLTWSRVSLNSADFGGFAPWSVTAGGPGLVAVGSTGAAEQFDGVAAVWTSVDGFTWSRVSHHEAIFPQGWIASVTVGGPGLVAVGSTGTPDELFVGDGDVAVWTSVDGLVWSRVPHDEALLGRGMMNSVTAGGPGLVAVGEDKDDAAVWTSVDGLVWSRVPHNEDVFGGPDLFPINFDAVSPDSMESVTSGGPGLVAVGQDNGDAAVWTSVDGFIWSRVRPADQTVLGGTNKQIMLSVTVGGPGLVAVGQEEDGPAPWDYINAVVWTSVDGITWSRVPHDETVFGRQGLEDRQGMNSVSAGGPGLVAVGFAEDGRDKDTRGAVWVTEED